MSPGFTYFHVSVERCDLLCKFKYKGFTHMIKEHIEVIDEKNKTIFRRDKVVKTLMSSFGRRVSQICK